MKAASPQRLSIHIRQGLALNRERSKTQINTQCEIVIITVKTCVVFQYFETNQVLSCFWQAKILYGSREIVVVFLFFFGRFTNIKVKWFKTVLFFWICTMLGLLRHVFPSCSAVTAHSWNAPHDETESWKTRTGAAYGWGTGTLKAAGLRLRL